jgi:hypothetical protein
LFAQEPKLVGALGHQLMALTFDRPNSMCAFKNEPIQYLAGLKEWVRVGKSVFRDEAVENYDRCGSTIALPMSILTI